MIKSLSKLDIERSYLNKVKGIYNKPIANITVNEEKAKNVSFKIKNITKFTLTTIIQYHSRSCSKKNLSRESRKRHTNRKRGSQFFFPVYR
jgi:hypothetical protein